MHLSDTIHSDISDQQQLLFFPTYAYRLIDQKDFWKVKVHGWLYHRQRKSMLRHWLLNTVLRVMGLRIEPEYKSTFFSKISWFFGCV